MLSRFIFWLIFSNLQDLIERVYGNHSSLYATLSDVKMAHNRTSALPLPFSAKAKVPESFANPGAHMLLDSRLGRSGCDFGAGAPDFTVGATCGGGTSRPGGGDESPDVVWKVL